MDDEDYYDTYSKLAHDWIVHNPVLWDEMGIDARIAASAGRTFSVRDWFGAQRYKHLAAHKEGGYAYPHCATHDIGRYLVDEYPQLDGFIRLREFEDDGDLPPLGGQECRA